MFAAISGGKRVLKGMAGLFTGVRGRIILRSSPVQNSANFGFIGFYELRAKGVLRSSSPKKFRNWLIRARRPAPTPSILLVLWQVGAERLLYAPSYR